jgi:hypothetical protein
MDKVAPFCNVPSMNTTGGTRAATIRRLRGILKRKPGEKSLTEAMVEHKRQEKKLEEAKINRLK